MKVRNKQVCALAGERKKERLFSGEDNTNE